MPRCGGSVTAPLPSPAHFLADLLMLRYWTAGESHGPALTALVDGFPAGLVVDTDLIDAELRRRQGGYGRGGRQRNDTDPLTFLSGHLQGKPLESPSTRQALHLDAKLEWPENPDRSRPAHAGSAG